MNNLKNDLPKSSEENFFEIPRTNEELSKEGDNVGIDAASAFNRELQQLQNSSRPMHPDEIEKNESRRSSNHGLTKLISEVTAPLNLPDEHKNNSPELSPNMKGTYCKHGKRNNGYLCLTCPGKGICIHKKQKYSCKICKEKSSCRHGYIRGSCSECRQSKSKYVHERNQFGDLSPITTPINPLQAAAGIVNALNFFQTTTSSPVQVSNTYEHSSVKKTLHNEYGVTEVLSAMVRAIEHCHLKAQGVNLGLAGALQLHRPKTDFNSSRRFTNLKGSSGGRIEFIETGADGKKKRKYKYVCAHGKNKYFCKPCGGSMICKHQKQRHYCTICRPEKRKMKRRKLEDAKPSIDDMLPLPSSTVQGSNEMQSQHIYQMPREILPEV